MWLLMCSAGGTPEQVASNNRLGGRWTASGIVPRLQMRNERLENLIVLHLQAFFDGSAVGAEKDFLGEAQGLSGRFQDVRRQLARVLLQVVRWDHGADQAEPVGFLATYPASAQAKLPGRAIPDYAAEWGEERWDVQLDLRMRKARPRRQTRISHRVARSNPPPVAGPFTAAMVGLGKFITARW